MGCHRQTEGRIREMEDRGNKSTRLETSSQNSFKGKRQKQTERKDRSPMKYT